MNILKTYIKAEFEEIKEALSAILPPQDWYEICSNHMKIHHSSGITINWMPREGKFVAEGDKKEADKILIQIEKLIKEKFDEPDQEKNNGIISNLINDSTLLGYRYSESEIVIGIVSAVGTESKIVTRYLKESLKHHSYDVMPISVSRDVISEIKNPRSEFRSEIDRINHFMDLGNELRDLAKDYSVLALGVAALIHDYRMKTDPEHKEPMPQKRKAYIIDSLKHPHEVEKLREIYTDGFYLIGIAENEKRRVKHLTRDHKSSDQEAEQLIIRDRDETDGHGQHTRDTFQLSDFFINLDGNSDKTRADIYRTIGLIFGNPYLTPTFDEYAMFMAFTSALRSADLSRQVGAVVARDQEIIATGANDSPRFGGGLYWPIVGDHHEITDLPGGRDYMRGIDSNKEQQQAIIQNILDKLPANVEKESIKKALHASKLADITEYGRIVHAEMESLLFCARNGISTRNAKLYCTTFPCHNCAKHIIAAGISKVIYIEPYPKSKAFEFYNDAITSDTKENDKVIFAPFVGVGPRRFFDLFSTKLSAGYPVKRKNKSGRVLEYHPEQSKARIQMLPWSYIEKETFASHLLNEFIDANKSTLGQELD